MGVWLKMTNIAWVRMALADEPDDTKRREIEAKLAQLEAELQTYLFGDGVAHA
jgi:hypothetical protein